MVVERPEEGGFPGAVVVARCAGATVARGMGVAGDLRLPVGRVRGLVHRGLEAAHLRGRSGRGGAGAAHTLVYLALLSLILTLLTLTLTLLALTHPHPP